MEEYIENYQDDVGSGMLYPPMGAHSTDKADLLEKIDPTLIVETIRNRLMGKVFINGEWLDHPALRDRAISEKGAWDISNLMLAVSSQNVSISKLTNDEIRERSYNLTKTAIHMCLKNWKEYGIRGKDQMAFVKEIVFSNTFITLKQPEGEGIRKLLMGTLQESKVRQESESSKSGGLSNLFKPKAR